jgi:hypothetical protein
MSLPDPAADLRSFLTGKTAGGVLLTSGTNLFSGRRLTPDLSPAVGVFLLNTGGMPPQPYMGSTRSAYYTPAVQVLVRGPVNDVAAGEALARGVLELLNQATVAGYVQVLSRDSAPALLLVDSANRGVWATNVDCSHVASLA